MIPFIKKVTILSVCLVLVQLGSTSAQAQSSVKDVTASAAAALNAERAKKGRAAVAPNKALANMAVAHARDMAKNGFFSHTSSNGGGIKQRSRAAGYRYCSINENLAKGYGDLAKVIEQWRGSPAHSKNMYSRKVREFGLARGPGNTWVLVMGRRC